MQIPLSITSHVVVVVMLDGQRWLCDHGFGGAVYVPLLLEDKATIESCKGDILFTRFSMMQAGLEPPVNSCSSLKEGCSKQYPDLPSRNAA